jgi:phosphoribosylformimino-5-aminoimidazole carboxamide ribotide isomerase
VKVQVGGGIRTIEQARDYAAAGASRVVLGTRVAQDPSFVREVSNVIDVVAAIDAKDGRVAVEGWTVVTDTLARDLAKACVSHGAQAVLYTDIARDGTGEGPSVEATAALARELAGVEVIASGGIGSLDHLRALAARPEVASVVVGRALYERAFTVAEAIAAGEGR